MEVVEGGGGVGVGGGDVSGPGVGGSGVVPVHEVVNRVSGWLIVVVMTPSEAIVTTDVLPGMVSTDVVRVGVQAVCGGTAVVLVEHISVLIVVVTRVGGRVVVEVIAVRTSSVLTSSLTVVRVGTVTQVDMLEPGA